MQRRISLRSFLIGMAAALAIPIAVFVVLLLNQLEMSDQAALERRTLREVNAVSSAVGLLLNDMKSTLDLIASAPDLEIGELKEFHYRTGRILAGSGKFVIVVDRTGRQLLNTRVAFGKARGKTSDMASLTKALETGNTVVSDVFLGRTSGKYVFNVVKPLPETALSPARGLIITKNADETFVAFGSQELPAGWNAAILDSQGRIVASTEKTELKTGTPSLLFSQLSRPDAGGVFRDDTDNVLYGYSRIPGSGWHVIEWGPISSARLSLLQNWQLLLASGSFILIFLVAISLFAAGALRSSVSRLAKMAERVGDGEVVSPDRSRLSEIDAVAIALSNASFNRSEAEQQTKIIMGELTHRTKNLMAVVMSMVRQTARHSANTDIMAETLGHRVAALGASLELLTRGTVGHVSLRELIERQLASFCQELGSITIEGNDLEISSDVAQNLGMVLHELATNATKYGALSVREGHVGISWDILDGDSGNKSSFVLRWKETSGPQVSEPERTGFGNVVIKDHIRSVTKGTVEMTYNPAGFEWSLTAPLALVIGDQPPDPQE